MIYEREHKKKCITVTVDGSSSFIFLSSNILLYFYFIRTSWAIAWNFTRYKIFWLYFYVISIYCNVALSPY